MKSSVWALVFLVCASAASAQSATPPPSPAPESEPPVHFMPRAAFHLSAEHLSGEDESFSWDANFGGDLDIVDYNYGRFAFYANYQVIMGTEFRRFDPNQGNYILGGLASLRRSGFEFAGVFHHESRHLSDRPNRIAVAWNMAGGRVSHVFVTGPVRIDAHADIRGVVAKAFVDYRWEIDTGARSDVQIRPRIHAFVVGDVRHLGVDGQQNRGGPSGYRAEAGVHLTGGAGAMEFFVSGERRIDPYPLEFGTSTWATVGFRLLTR